MSNGVSGVELAITGTTGPWNSQWGIDLYVDASGELMLHVSNQDEGANVTLNKAQARLLARALLEYGDDENPSSN